MFGFDFVAADPVTGILATLLPETEALIARMTARPSAPRCRAINTLIATLMTPGATGTVLWDRLDVLQIYAAASLAEAGLNWKGPGATATVLAGAPVFVADRGVWTDGLDDVFDTGFIPSSGVQFQQGSASLGAWFRKSDRTIAQPIGTPASNSVSVNSRNANGQPAARLNGSTVVAGPAVGSGYGLTAANRDGSALTLYARGVAVGTASGASTTRSAASLTWGRQNGAQADGQVCAFFAGAALSPAAHADLKRALSIYLATLGVTEIVPETRTLAMAGAITLPDGSAPVGAGRGMGATGLTRRPDGRWYVANGIAGRSDLWFSRLSADLQTVEAEFRASGFGLSSDFHGSVQGLTIDHRDASLWFVLKLSGAAGTTTHLMHMAVATETLIGNPIPIHSGDNGIACEPAADGLWIVRDGSAAGGSFALHDQSGRARTGSYPIAPDADHCHFISQTGNGFLAGDLLVTAGGNGSDGVVLVLNRLDAGGMTVRRIDTLSGATQIEGIVTDGAHYVVVNDGATHPGSPPLNRVLRYAC